MATSTTEKIVVQEGAAAETLINDVVIRIATANGSGSQSANQILMRSIFGMGVPVGNKNMFPSNIEGLPTWYVIRANEHGWVARRANTDILVAMNAQSAEQDLGKLNPGTIVIIDDALKGLVKRDDLELYFVPFRALSKEACDDAKLRKKIVNMIYVGVVAWMLDIDMEEIVRSLERQFSGKDRAIELNRSAIDAGFHWADENLTKQQRFRIERSDKTAGKILIDGNEAAALGMLFGGVTVLAWYPITPSSSICESLTRYLDTYRRDPETGKATYAVIQAEDEIASIGITMGAGWMGARACTATSGPGLSLMAEMAGLSYFAEVPAVIVDVQRMGPSTGLPTRTSQGDILAAYQLSHGDTRHVLLIPGTMEECYEFCRQSLDLAEELQTLIIVMSDLDLGMNQWMSKPFDYPSEPLKRGKVLTAEDIEARGGFQRYRDVDGDGIDYRTLPGTDHPEAAYFTRGTGHNEQAEYSERSRDWKDNMDRLLRKYDTARELVPKPIVEEHNQAEIAFIAYGSSDLAVEEARDILEKKHGIMTSYLRIRALPVNGEVTEFVSSHKRVYIVDQNRDAQMATILRSEYPKESGKMRSILKYDGLPIDARSVVEQLIEQEEVS